MDELTDLQTSTIHLIFVFPNSNAPKYRDARTYLKKAVSPEFRRADFSYIYQQVQWDNDASLAFSNDGLLSGD